MKRFNYKSRKGFTLIELLVVIGILAVLAAIAIPSVAGLIDRANVSADDTNANEMTNALERFTSEYELFCQDIASGKLNTNDLDAAQSRVYNVTGADDRSDIEALENNGLNGKAIDRDTKYPKNIATAKSIVENYTKTSSATFEPKQSDMNFYYSPDCGVIVFSEATDEPNVEELNKLIISGKDAKGKTLNGNTVWINLTTGTVTDVLTTEKYNHNGNLIPEGATYQIKGGALLVAGQPFPAEVKTGDEYSFGDYIYKFNYYYSVNATTFERKWFEYSNSTKTNSWTAAVNDITKENYSYLLFSINNLPVSNIERLFQDCVNLKNISSDFKIPTTVTSLSSFFDGCSSLTNIPSNFYIPSTIKTARSCFSACTSLTSIPSSFYIENGVEDLSGMFRWCMALSSISNNFRIPSTAKNLGVMFGTCKKLEILPEGFNIPNSVTDMHSMFESCISLKYIPDTFTISTSTTTISTIFNGCSKLERIPNNFVIPSNVTNVMGAFTNCKKLTGTIYSYANPTSYYNVLSGVNGPLTIYSAPSDWLTENADGEAIIHKPL